MGFCGHADFACRGLPVPFIGKGEKTFEKSTVVELSCIEPSAEIFYQAIATSNDGTDNFRKYTKPIKLSRSRKIRYYAQKDDDVSPVMEASFFKLPSNREISLKTAYSSQYSAGGDNALIDMIRGERNFRTGAWQGYEKVDIVAEVDLGSVRSINRLEISCFQDQDFWVFMPLSVEFEISIDGKEWTSYGIVENDISDKLVGAFIKPFIVEYWGSARYVRVRAENMGLCPDWHKGAGMAAWIFADEFVVR